MNTLKKRLHRERLESIGTFTTTHGYGPSVRELQDEWGLQSTSVVHYNLKAMRERGLISFTDGMARTIRLTPEGTQYLKEGSE